MSKELEEVIAFLEQSITYANLTSKGVRNTKEQIDKLRTLAKPVQYVVQVSSVPSYIFDDRRNYYKAMLNGRKISNEYDIEDIKGKSFELINSHTKLLGLPPITIEQITFEEV